MPGGALFTLVADKNKSRNSWELYAGDVALFDAARFVDQALEDATYSFAIEGAWRAADEAIEHAAFALGIVDGHADAAFVVSDSQDDAYALGDDFEDAGVDFVDGLAQGVELS